MAGATVSAGTPAALDFTRRSTSLCRRSRSARSCVLLSLSPRSTSAKSSRMNRVPSISPSIMPRTVSSVSAIGSASVFGHTPGCVVASSRYKRVQDGSARVTPRRFPMGGNWQTHLITAALGIVPRGEWDSLLRRRCDDPRVFSERPVAPKERLRRSDSSAWWKLSTPSCWWLDGLSSVPVTVRSMTRRVIAADTRIRFLETDEHDGGRPEDGGGSKSAPGQCGYLARARLVSASGANSLI